MSFSDSEVDSLLNVAMIYSVSEPIDRSWLWKRNKKRSPVKSQRSKSVDSNSSGSIDLHEFLTKYPLLEEAKRGRGRERGTESKCEQNSPNLADFQLFLPRRGKSTYTNTSTSKVAENLVPPVSEPARRSRSHDRGRGRGRKSPKMICNVFNNMISMIRSRNKQAIATYSVGNTDEYPDQCDSQALFSQKKNDVVEVEDLNGGLEDNEEFSVKVHWQSLYFFQFKIRKHQKFTVMFNFFAKQENVTHDKLLFTYQERILREEDTPGGIDYSVANFIEGGIVSQSVALLLSDTQDNTDGIKLKFQCQNIKKPFEIYVKPEDKMSIAMMRCAEHLEKPVDQLKFEFDGDLISGKNTAQDLELEGGECIDVKILS